MKLSVIVAFFLVVFSQFFNIQTVNAQTEIKDINNITLANGMRIIVLEDHSIPNANMYLFWKVGSRNEYPGITGLSHFFEHMMFNGSKHYAPKQFDRVMEAHGGANNAYTTKNVTVYTNWFPSDALETIFALEADRIENLSIDPTMVESERAVVSSERSTGLENSNINVLFNEVDSAAFKAHPYSFPVIGFQSDIDNWSMADLKNYHRTYYAPNNAFVVISGDVTVAQVKALATKYFAPIPAQPKPRKIHTVEPKQQGERRVFVHKPSASSVNLLMAYHVPATKHQDHYPLQILSNVLGAGENSRLHKALIENNSLATEVWTYLPNSFDANLIYIYAKAAQGVSAQVLEKAINDEVNRIAISGISQQELQKVQNNAQVNFYRQLAKIDGKSNVLGTYELFYGSYKAMFAVPNKLNKVTIEQVKNVAAHYLRKENKTIAILSAQKASSTNDSEQGDL